VKKTSLGVSRFTTHMVLSLFSLLMIFPVFVVILDSLKSQRELYMNPWGFPKALRFSNYVQAWSIGKIGDYYINTVVVTLGSLLLIVAITYLASFALARFSFLGKSIVMILLFSTMMFPLQVTIIPIYKIEKIFGITDSLLGLIIPYTARALPFSIFILTAFLKTLPMDFDEAARIDGASRFTILTRILVPLSKPGFATVVILNFHHIWNDFFLPLILIHDPTKRTLNLGLVNFSQLWGLQDYTRLFAALVIISLPLIIMYVFFQKQFISGLTSGGLRA
jgi:ABC-type glycerol-3-phosphate transport system permease component